MEHKEFERLIQQSLDHETNIAEERILKSHLAGCPRCRNFYEELFQTTQAIGGLIEFFPDHNFNEQVLKKIGLGRSHIWTRAAAVLAGAWLGALLCLIFLPLPKVIFSEFIGSIPAAFRLLDKAGLVLLSFRHTLIPFAKNFFNPLYAVLALIFGIFMLYFFNKIIKEEIIYEKTLSFTKG